MSETLYKTKQRETVCAFLKNNPSHSFTVDELYEQLKKTQAVVGKTTVYRCLDGLVNSGEVRKFFSHRGGSASYQFVGNHSECTEHFHLKCTECGELIHLSCDYMKEIDKHILGHHDFYVDNTKTVLYGLCGKCKRKLDKGRKD
ncbi:MAG: transcriptional repressor [Clostridia bacterium]|nr:transcriptional repressor [Clostridia bacterium]